ncbi:MAG TPA: class III aminotransferase, partial [bacterium]|nr:class III aminotransferase [bacterium]
MTANWTFTELDKKIADEISDFLPERIFDSHAHLWRVSDWKNQQSGVYTEGPQVATIDTWREYIGRQVGEKHLTGGLFLGIPMCEINSTNEFLLEQLRDEPESRALICISPDYPQKKASEYIKNPVVAGFKPYHTYSRENTTFQSSIAGYLPEWAWKMANENGLVITLHLVKDRALADPENQREIRNMCLKYPNVKLILAHAARGFHSYNTVQGISSLKGLENVWFDTSAVCEPAAIIAILQEFGPRKLLWGSDFCVSEIRGKCVTAGDGFIWLTGETVSWDTLSPACYPTLVGLESLRALKEAADITCLNSEDIQNIFCDNALRLLVFTEEPGTITQERYTYAKKVIPGGTQLLSKRPELYAPD